MTSWQRVRALLVTATVVLLCPFFDNAAFANNYAPLNPGGQTGCGSPPYRADNKTHYYAFTGATQKVQDAVNWARDYAIAPTIVTAVLRPDISSQTDAKVTDYPYTGYCGEDWLLPNDPDGGIVGLYQCDDVLSNGRCQQATVRFNTTYTDNAGPFDMHSLACHEMGHSIGLQHRPYGCMKLGEASSAVYTDHDKAHLTADFG